MKIITWIAAILMVIGALNWGFIAFFNGFNLVTTLFTEGSTMTTIVYGLVGLSGLYAIFWILPKMK